MKPIFYKGQTYKSLKALYRTHAANGILYQTFIERYKRDWPMDEALTSPQHKRELPVFCVNGVNYVGLAKLADAANLRYETARKRYERGWSAEEIFYGREKAAKPERPRTPRGKAVIVAGIEYENMSHAHAVLAPKATLNAVKARLREKWTLEQAFEVEEKNDGRKLRRDRGSYLRLKQEYTAFGITYSSVTKLARAHSCDPRLVYHRLRNNWSPERAVTAPATNAVQINGRTYRSAFDAWRRIGKVSDAVFQARKQAGHELEICLGLKPLKDQSLIHNGVKYDSLAHVASSFGIKESVLLGRTRRMSLEEAITYNPANGRYSWKRFNDDQQLAQAIGFLYFIEVLFDDDILHKIGITRRTVKARFAANRDISVIALIEGRLVDLYGIEQNLIKEFCSYHVRGDEGFEGRTETFRFTEESEKLVLETIKVRSLALGSEDTKLSIYR